jgi:hypothetical protein
MAPSSAHPSARRPDERGLRKWFLDAKCLTALIVMRLALSTIGYAAISRVLPRPPERGDSRFWGRQVGCRIERLAHFVPRASCLTQALALKYILGRAGHACNLQIGVRKADDGTFLAHAWVTCNDRIVLGQRGTQIDQFTRIAELG